MNKILGILLFFVVGVSYAARPMITDDARIVDVGSCQVESWAKFNKETNEFWALPSCNLSGNLEIAFGGAKLVDATENSDWGVRQIQLKTLFKPPSTNNWSAGIAAGQIKTSAHNLSTGFSDNYFYLPFTQSLLNDDLFIHLNMGGSQINGEKKYKPTYGAGFELLIAEKSYLIFETFQDSSEKISFQGGIRHWVEPNRFQIDMTLGNKSHLNHTNTWLSIGVRLLSPKWF